MVSSKPLKLLMVSSKSFKFPTFSTPKIKYCGRNHQSQSLVYMHLTSNFNCSEIWIAIHHWCSYWFVASWIYAPCVAFYFSNHYWPLWTKFKKPLKNHRSQWPDGQKTFNGDGSTLVTHWCQGCPGKNISHAIVTLYLVMWWYFW